MSRGSCLRLAAVALAVAVVPVTAARAGSSDETFYQAYYLDRGAGDPAAAMPLYEKVIADRSVDERLRAEARSRLAACREELSTRDFARLMPPQTLAYFELNRPGEQISRLLDQLGLLRGRDGRTEQRIAISPELIQAVLGLRGAAVAVTGFDPVHQQPVGVAVLHPGELDIVRGLIETGVPIQGKPVEPVEGFATYQIEGQAYVTLTQRLVVISNQPSLIQEVVRRINGQISPSLADDPVIAPAIAARGDDALLFFCVNAKKVMPIVSGMMAAGAAQNREVAMANALLDPASLELVAGRVGIGRDGIGLDVQLQLADGHRNLIYNLLRLPPLERETLAHVPDGAAAFVAVALNERAPAGEAAAKKGESPAAPVVTAMDFGREVFGNIVSLAVFALPPEGGAPAGGAPAGGPPIPDVAAVITVNDPGKSEALWAQLLGVAGMVSGRSPLKGDSVEIAGVQARSFTVEGGVTVYLAHDGHDMIVSPSKSAVARAIEAGRSGRSILDDARFAATRERIGPSTTKLLFAHPQRCAQIARLYARPAEMAQVEPILAEMGETTASILVSHSDREFRISARVSGLPKVGGLVSAMFTNMQGQRERQAQAQAQRRGRIAAVERAGTWEKAEAELAALEGAPEKSFDVLMARFKALALLKKDREAALAVGEALFASIADNPLALNNFAWALLTEEQYAGQYAELALKCAQRSNERTAFGNWAYLDTLALAKFQTGRLEEAVDLQRKAIALAGEDQATELKAALERYESAMQESASARNG